MIELPEAVNLSKQLKIVFNKKIVKAVAAHSPNKFAWYSGDPSEYSRKLVNKKILSAEPAGGSLKINVEDVVIVLSEGINLRYLKEEKDVPKTHQLLLTFEDSTLLCASVQMYGGLLCSQEKDIENPYYLSAVKKPSPLTKEFNKKYFTQLFSGEEVQKLSIKALLATEQRIPGLGNGVLQDILLNAGIHPKKKVNSITPDQQNHLFDAVKSTLKDMAAAGGRDTEKDLFGDPGGYKTLLSKNTVDTLCSRCGSSTIQKASYMGGSIYFCQKCQVL